MKTSLRYKLANFAKKQGFRFNSRSDEAVMAMQREIAELGFIEFRIERFADGDWMAQSVNIDGILTGGTAKDDLDETIKDAVFTYYGVMPEHCDDKLLKAAGEAKVVRQEVFVTA